MDFFATASYRITNQAAGRRARANEGTKAQRGAKPDALFISPENPDNDFDSRGARRLAAAAREGERGYSIGGSYWHAAADSDKVKVQAFSPN